MSSPAPRHVAVIDIGKTNAKLVLVDFDTLSEVAVRTTPNTVLAGGPYPHFDCDRLWSFILDGLASFASQGRVDAISITTHGCAAALLGDDGLLAMPVLDYEFDGPDRTREAYEDIRPSFSETGTPRLPSGLNLGAQIFWQERTFPAEFARVRTILTYPQYWAFRLSGLLASEATSLGCHSDLWNPQAGDFSSLVGTLGWRALFPPLRKASDTLGPLLPDIAARTGLDPATPVLCGIHDSNASLLPHLLSRQPPFAVVSTGTWVVAMAVGATDTPPDPARDTLVNVNALGDPVPSARFMGGREFETLMQGRAREWSRDDVAAVLAGNRMLLPSVQQGSGPFPTQQAGWLGPEPRGGERFVATSFYLALMTATCLDLIGAAGEVVVEGPFGSNPPYLSMLSHATRRRVATSGNGNVTGTSIGAALLAGSRPAAWPDEIAVADPDPAFERYAQLWRNQVSAPAIDVF